MESLLDKAVLMQNIDGATCQPENSRAATLAIALVEIREAIEMQTQLLSGVQQDWDQAALARLFGIAERHDQGLGAQLHAIHDGQARLGAIEAKLDAFEQALQGVIHHQGETAKLMQALAERIEKCAGGWQRAGPEGPGLPGGPVPEPTSG